MKNIRLVHIITILVWSKLMDLDLTLRISKSFLSLYV